MFRILAGVEVDLHRDTLDDFHEVTGGVLRWQQAELRAGRGGDAVDVRFERAASKGVDGNIRLLPGAHGLQLRLLEVRRDPRVIEVYEREEGLARLNHLPWLDAL